MNRKFWLVLFLFALLLPLSALAAPGVMLVDQGHGQRFVVDKEGELDLSSLAGVLRDSGLTLRVSGGPLSPEALAGVQALLISGSFAPYTSEEITAVRRFVEEGGRLAVMLHIGPPLAGLLGEFGVVHSNGVIREAEQVIDGEPLNFQVTRLKPHPLFRDLSRFAVYGSWALAGDDPLAEVVAESGPLSWVDLNGDKKLGEGDAVQSFGVAVAGPKGRGRFVVFGDDALFQNRFLKDDNLALARNLAGWLAE